MSHSKYRGALPNLDLTEVNRKHTQKVASVYRSYEQMGRKAYTAGEPEAVMWRDFINSDGSNKLPFGHLPHRARRAWRRGWWLAHEAATRYAGRSKMPGMMTVTGAYRVIKTGSMKDINPIMEDHDLGPIDIDISRPQVAPVLDIPN